MVFCVNNLEELDNFLSYEPESFPSTDDFSRNFANNFDSVLLYISSQEELSVSENKYQEQVCNFIIESPFFKACSELIFSHIKGRSCFIGPENDLYSCLWLYYGLLARYRFSSGLSIELNSRERKHLFSKLVKEIEEPIDGRLELPAIYLLSEIVKKSISSNEIKILRDFIPFLFKLTECARENNEDICYAVIRLLINYHHQSLRACQDQLSLSSESIMLRFRKKMGFIIESSDPFCDSKAAPDFEGIIRCSPVLEFLQKNFCTAKTFGGDIIFMLNREDNKSNIISTLDFLTDLFNHPATSDYFYTNDLNVLVDILIRQLRNIDDCLYELRYSYINLLSSLMNFSQYSGSLHKIGEILELLEYMSSRFERSNPISSTISNQASQLLQSWRK